MHTVITLSFRSILPIREITIVIWITIIKYYIHKHIHESSTFIEYLLKEFTPLHSENDKEFIHENVIKSNKAEEKKERKILLKKIEVEFNWHNFMHCAIQMHRDKW